MKIEDFNTHQEAFNTHQLDQLTKTCEEQRLEINHLRKANDRQQPFTHFGDTKELIRQMQQQINDQIAVIDRQGKMLHKLTLDRDAHLKREREKNAANPPRERGSYKILSDAY